MDSVSSPDSQSVYSLVYFLFWFVKVCVFPHLLSIFPPVWFPDCVLLPRVFKVFSPSSVCQIVLFPSPGERFRQLLLSDLLPVFWISALKPSNFVAFCPLICRTLCVPLPFCIKSILRFEFPASICFVGSLIRRPGRDKKYMLWIVLLHKKRRQKKMFSSDDLYIHNRAHWKEDPKESGFLNNKPPQVRAERTLRTM